MRGALTHRPSCILIVGAGQIGCKAASCCRDLGPTVSLFDPNPTPLARLLETAIGITRAGRMRESGVHLCPDTKVQTFLGDGGQVRGAHLPDGAVGAGIGDLAHIWSIYLAVAALYVAGYRHPGRSPRLTCLGA